MPRVDAARTTLVASLGGQPQILTFTLDLLLQRGENVTQVMVIYLGGEARYCQAYRRLQQEFAGASYAGRPCRLQGESVCLGGEALAEARTPTEVEAVRRTFFELLGRLKDEGACLHVSLSGGRRILALTGLAAAMQHLTPADSLWHIHTPAHIAEEALDGRVMHVPPGSGVELVPVPFVPWAAYFPGLRPLLSGESLPAWQDGASQECCQQVWNVLTSRQRQTLECWAAGLSRAQTAEKLDVQVSTVDSHRKVIMRRWREFAAEGAGGNGVMQMQRSFALFLKSPRI